MEKIEKIRGTEDIFGKYAEEFCALKKHCCNFAKLYGYRYIETPIIENANLFVRSVGQTSDIVKKEFYNFVDKGDREIVLRPEGTASVIRSIVENKALNKLPTPIKCFYFGPMFRYERPQSGRLRQFHQFGVECINSNSYMDDAEAIIFAYNLIKSLKIKDVKLSINNIGSFKSREQWIKKLSKYFTEHKKELTEDSVKRINSNPLRIIDDKVDSKKEVVKNAPRIDEFLTTEEKAYFNNVKRVLEENKIPYEYDSTIVRGLDYYTNIVFEINTSNPTLKGQPTLVGGGRYAKLVSELGGEECSCLGFAIGIERILVLLKALDIELNKDKGIDCVLVCISEEVYPYALKLMEQLRDNDISCVCNFNNTKIKNQFKLADFYNARFALIIGEDEIKNKIITVKNQETRKEEKIRIEKLLEAIK